MLYSRLYLGDILAVGAPVLYLPWPCAVSATSFHHFPTYRPGFLPSIGSAIAGLRSPQGEVSEAFGANWHRRLPPPGRMERGSGYSWSATLRMLTDHLACSIVRAPPGAATESIAPQGLLPICNISYSGAPSTRCRRVPFNSLAEADVDCQPPGHRHPLETSI